MTMTGIVVTLVLTPIITTMASPVQEHQLKDNTHWKKLAEFTVRDSDIEVSKYKSGATGEFSLLLLSLTPRARSDRGGGQGGDPGGERLFLPAD